MASKLSELVTKAGFGPVDPEPLPVPVTVRLPFRVADAASLASIRMGVARSQLVRDWAEVGMEAMAEALGPDRWAALVSPHPTTPEEAEFWNAFQQEHEDIERDEHDLLHSEQAQG